jgi:hypothetical protein
LKRASVSFIEKFTSSLADKFATVAVGILVGGIVAFAAALKTGQFAAWISLAVLVGFSGGAGSVLLVMNRVATQLQAQAVEMSFFEFGGVAWKQWSPRHPKDAWQAENETKLASDPYCPTCYAMLLPLAGELYEPLSGARLGEVEVCQCPLCARRFALAKSASEAWTHATSAARAIAAQQIGTRTVHR